MWELSMFAKKNCCFRHSAVWVSLLQLVFLRFPHPLNFQLQLKKTTAQPTQCFGKQGKSRLACCGGDVGSTSWQRRWCPAGAAMGWWDQTASWCLSSLSFCSPPRCHWSWAWALLKASPWLPAIWWRCSEPVSPSPWDLPVPTHGPEDLRASEQLRCWMLKIAQRKLREHPLHTWFCAQTLLFPKISSSNSSWGALK